MTVGATLSGTHRWRTLEAASSLLCPIHNPPFRRKARGSALRHSRPCTFAPKPKASPTFVPAASSSAGLAGGRSRGAASPDNGAGAEACRRVMIVAAAVGAAALATSIVGDMASPSMFAHLFAKLPAPASSGAAAAAAAATAAAAAAAGTGLPPWLVCLVSLLPSLGSFLLCVAGAVFLLAAVPALVALARTASAAERLLTAVEAELPDTVAAMRLTGLELTDCVSELGALGGELTRGVRSTAAIATAAEAGLRGGVVAADAAIKNHVLPAAARAEKEARGAAEAHLTATAALPYAPAPLIGQAAAATAGAARKIRAGLAIGRLATAAVQAGRSARSAVLKRAEADAAAEVAAVAQRQQAQLAGSAAKAGAQRGQGQAPR